MQDAKFVKVRTHTLPEQTLKKAISPQLATVCKSKIISGIVIWFMIHSFQDPSSSSPPNSPVAHSILLGPHHASLSEQTKYVVRPSRPVLLVYNRALG
jgi:hypothetical protein